MPSMRQLIYHGDTTYVLSVQIALEAAGIPYVSSSFRTGAPTGLLVAESDYERARDAIRELQDTPMIAPGGSRTVLRILLAVAILVVAGMFVLATKRT